MLNSVSYRIKTSTEGVILDWTPVATNLNTTYYVTPFAINFNAAIPGINHVDVMASNFAGNTTVFIDAFTVEKDSTVPLIQVMFATNTVTWINSSQLYSVNFYSQGPSNLSSIQYAVNDNPGFTGTNLIPWTDIATPPLNAPSYTTPWHVAFSQLENGGTNYVSVRAWNLTGSTATIIDAFRVLKDVTNPTISDPMYGGDTVWRSTPAAGGYNVNFFDGPPNGSLLNSFQLKVTSGPAQTGSVYQNWGSSETLNIGTTYYINSWQLSNNTWSNMQQGYNYVSALVYDYAGNSNELTDAFFVLKDTTPPQITDNQTGDNTWRSSNTGVYSVSFVDTGGSNLQRFEVSASTSASGYPLLNTWTTVQYNINSGSYNTPWQMPASVLAKPALGCYRLYIRPRVRQCGSGKFIGNCHAGILCSG